MRTVKQVSDLFRQPKIAYSWRYLYILLPLVDIIRSQFIAANYYIILIKKF